MLLFFNLLAKYSDEVSVINNNGGIIKKKHVRDYKIYVIMVELRATSAIVKVTRSLEQLHAQITAHLLITNFFSQ